MLSDLSFCLPSSPPPPPAGGQGRRSAVVVVNVNTPLLAWARCGVRDGSVGRAASSYGNAIWGGCSGQLQCPRRQRGQAQCAPWVGGGGWGQWVCPLPSTLRPPCQQVLFWVPWTSKNCRRCCLVGAAAEEGGADWSGRTWGWGYGARRGGGGHLGSHSRGRGNVTDDDKTRGDHQREKDHVSNCPHFQDLEGCSSYVRDVGCRTPGGGGLSKVTWTHHHTALVTS
jgi:hypothetical protein